MGRPQVDSVGDCCTGTNTNSRYHHLISRQNHHVEVKQALLVANWGCTDDNVLFQNSSVRQGHGQECMDNVHNIDLAGKPPTAAATVHSPFVLITYA